jgi:anti-sigma factor RsiW
MNDCPNADMRDQLCDVVHRTLSDADCQRVEAHIAACADCTAEIALLRRAQAVLARQAPSVDTAAIVSALPRRRAPRPMAFPAWRVAASIAVIAVGAASISIARMDSAGGVGDGSSTRRAAATATGALTLSFAGRLSVLEDEDLEQLLAEIDEFDGETPVEPRVILPVPAWDGGTP